MQLFYPTLCIDDLGTIMINILYYRQMLKVPAIRQLYQEIVFRAITAQGRHVV